MGFFSDSAMAIGNPPLLCGKGSKDLKAEMEAGLPSNNRDKLIKMCSKFFSVRDNIALCFTLTYPY